LSQSNNLGDGRFWRIFAGITFLNQLVRVPLLLSLATTAADLEAYFVIAATSIPVQFIAQDILQYRSGAHRLSVFESRGLPLFACGSIAYVTWHHGLTIGGSYLIFAVALLFYGATVGRLREVFSPERVLASDALYNTCTTLLAATAALLLKGDMNLGHAVILSQAGTAAAVGLLNVITTRLELHSRPVTPAQRTASEGTNMSTPMLLAGIMVTTQLERLVIAASQPAVLACIALAAGFTQAWRKIGMDDALVFARLRGRRDDELFQTMRVEIRHARRVFYPPLLLALLAYGFIDYIAAWCGSHDIFRSLDRASYATTAAILCIYLAAMPPAIVMINTLRQRVVPMHRLGWVALFTVAFVEIAALAYPYSLGRYIDQSLAIITLTASLSHTLFLALCSAQIHDAVRLLFFDIAVFSLIVVTLIWL
jgi:hypothetical protein